MSIKSIIQQSKKAKLLKANPEAKQIAEIIVTQMLEQLVPELEEKVQVAITNLEGQISDISLTPGEKGDSITGDRGECGEKGEQGLEGATGAVGASGKDGADGKDGKKGIDGLDGINGVDGLSGKDGEDGKDGSSDEPIEIAEKLNTLKEEVDIKVIKGLNNWMNNIKQLVKKKDSGGGGDIVKAYDLSSSLNGVTKIFTIPKVRKIISVHLSSVPGILRETTDFTYTSNSITFTAEIQASTSLLTGQTCVIVYVV